MAFRGKNAIQIIRDIDYLTIDIGISQKTVRVGAITKNLSFLVNLGRKGFLKNVENKI
jgi:hypothetical protein